MSIKGAFVEALSGLAVRSPLRDVAERALVSAGHRFPTSRTVQSFSRHFGRKLMEREGQHFERIATFASGGRMRCGPDGHQIGPLSLMHYFLGTITGQIEDERPVVQLMDRLVQEGDVFFDVGANFGFYSLYVGPLCGRSGAVHAFEANPVLIPPLERSIALNVELSNICLNPVAVGRESNTFLPLYGTERIGNSSFHAHGWLNEKDWVKVPVIALDDYVRDNHIERLDVMKIDIEGAELDALRGMTRIFDTCPPKAIVCELMPSAISSRAPTAARPGEIAQFLHERGYLMCEISESDGRLRLPEISVERIERAPQVVNVAFVKSSLQNRMPDCFRVENAGHGG